MSQFARLRVFLSLVFCAASVCLVCARDVRIPSLDTEDPPAVILYEIPGNEMTPPGGEFEFYQVQVAAWADGRVVWSSRFPRAGAPYFSDKIDAARVAQVLQLADGLSTITRQQSLLIVDARATHIEIKSSNGKSLELASSHPHFTSPRLQVKSTGISVRDDNASTTTPLSEKEAAFDKFRTDFDSLAQSIRDLAPATTTSMALPLKFRLQTQ